MKTLLNLLPEENKKNILRRAHARFFLWQLFLVFALEIFYVCILVATFIVLNFQLQDLKSTGQTTKNTIQDRQLLSSYQKKFRDMNTTVETITKIQNNHFFFTQTFLLLDELLPEGMVVDQLTTKNYTVLLVGKALKRDDLLAFDARLKASACVENVNVPISNLFSQKNVDFQIDFGIKKECLKKPL